LNAGTVDCVEANETCARELWCGAHIIPAFAPVRISGCLIPPYLGRTVRQCSRLELYRLTLKSPPDSVLKNTLAVANWNFARFWRVIWSGRRGDSKLECESLSLGWEQEIQRLVSIRVRTRLDVCLDCASLSHDLQLSTRSSFGPTVKLSILKLKWILDVTVVFSYCYACCCERRFVIDIGKVFWRVLEFHDYFLKIKIKCDDSVVWWNESDIFIYRFKAWH
jgi:hypothetical protein